MMKARLLDLYSNDTQLFFDCYSKKIEYQSNINRKTIEYQLNIRWFFHVVGEIEGVSPFLVASMRQDAAASKTKNGHRLNADARCPKNAQIRVIRGDYRFTTFRTATRFPSATAFTK